ncbi:site-specific integrase [Vibrio cholerae]
MAKIIVAKEVQIGGEVSVNNERLTSLSFSNSSHITSVPTLYCQNGTFVEPVNHWFIYLKSVKRLEDLNSYSRALLRYWNFLESNQLSWDNIPTLKSAKPTYQFRNFNLIPSIKDGSLSSSTANTYIRHVTQFYAWAMYEQILQLPPERFPFQVQDMNIRINGPLRHLKPKITVQTNDLRIREPNKNISSSVHGLNPLNMDDVKLFFKELSKESIEFRLMCLLACCSGLRASEVSSLTIDSLQTATPTSDIKNRFTLSIGPKLGVNTKFMKTRKIEVSSELLRELNNYCTSERRFKRIEIYNNKQKKTNISYEHIFISQQGNLYSPATLAARWGDFRKRIRTSNNNFNYKFHDLRSTYATYRIGDLLDSGIGEYDAIDTLMGYMGHNNETTTFKYIRYRKRREAISNKFTMLDNIMNDVCSGVDFDE